MNDYTVDGKSSIDSSQFVSNKSAAISINKSNDKLPRLKPSRFQFDKLKTFLLNNLDTPSNEPQKYYSCMVCMLCMIRKLET